MGEQNFKPSSLTSGPVLLTLIHVPTRDGPFASFPLNLVHLVPLTRVEKQNTGALVQFSHWLCYLGGRLLTSLNLRFHIFEMPGPEWDPM